MISDIFNLFVTFFGNLFFNGLPDHLFVYQYQNDKLYGFDYSGILQYFVCYILSVSVIILCFYAIYYTVKKAIYVLSR